MPLESGYVAPLHGELDRNLVITMALTAFEHFGGSARWVITDLRDVDVDSVAAMVSDTGHVRDMDRMTRGIGRDQPDVVLHAATVCSADVYTRVVPPLLSSLAEVAGTRGDRDRQLPRFDTLTEAFAWEHVSNAGPVPDWAVALDANRGA